MSHHSCLIRLAGSCYTKSSPERGTKVLAKLRGKTEDDLVVKEETVDIQTAINIETAEEGSWKSLLLDGGCAAKKRFLLALGIQSMQQTSGEFFDHLFPLICTHMGISQASTSSPTMLRFCSRIVWACRRRGRSSWDASFKCGISSRLSSQYEPPVFEPFVSDLLTDGSGT